LRRSRLKEKVNRWTYAGQIAMAIAHLKYKVYRNYNSHCKIPALNK